MMADKRIASLVVGQRCRARGTLGHESAIAAENELGETALVEQQDRLMACRQFRLEFSRKPLREHRARTALELMRHVDHFDFRHRFAIRALWQGNPMPERVFRSMVEAFNRRCSRPQHDCCPCTASHPDGNVASMVAWCAVLLVRAFMLFVDHDETEIAQWREQGASRTDHNTRLT